MFTCKGDKTMIGLMILAVIFGYIFLSKFITNKVYKTYGTKKARNIALAIMILIPTWDIILGYPIYKVLCWTNAGVHIYKTVDNVEGFYVGEKRMENEPHEPYDGYKYIEYEETKHYKPTGKYYRSYWIDSNISKECIHYGNYKYSLYAKAFRSGRCIVKEEISESEVSQWAYIEKSKTIIKLFLINIRLDSTGYVIDTTNQKKLSELTRVIWQGGWFYGFLSSIPVGNNWKIKYPKIIDIKSNEIIRKTLILKNGDK